MLRTSHFGPFLVLFRLCVTIQRAECGHQRLSGTGWNPLSTQTSVFHCGNRIDLWLYNYSTYTPSNTHCPSSVSLLLPRPTLSHNLLLCSSLLSVWPRSLLLFFPLIASFFPLLSYLPLLLLHACPILPPTPVPLSLSFTASHHDPQTVCLSPCSPGRFSH